MTERELQLELHPRVADCFCSECTSFVENFASIPLLAECHTGIIFRLKVALTVREAILSVTSLAISEVSSPECLKTGIASEATPAHKHIARRMRVDVRVSQLGRRDAKRVTAHSTRSPLSWPLPARR